MDYSQSFDRYIEEIINGIADFQHQILNEKSESESDIESGTECDRVSRYRNKS